MTDAISSVSSTTIETEHKGRRNRLQGDMATDPLYTMGSTTVGDTYEFGMATVGAEEDYVVGKPTQAQKTNKADDKAKTKENLEEQAVENAQEQAKDEVNKTEGDLDNEGRTEDEIANDLAEKNITRINDHIDMFGIDDISWITIK